jgi:hypothetical protein
MNLRHSSENPYHGDVNFYQIHISTKWIPTTVSINVFSGRMLEQISNTSEDYRQHHCVSINVLSSYALDQMPCHTPGGLDSNLCVSVNVTPDNSVQQMCYHIYTHYFIKDALT